MKLTSSRLVDGSSCGGIDIVIKDLDLKPKIDAMMRDFLNLSRWKELSKETSSKILPGGDGLQGRTFKPNCLENECMLRKEILLDVVRTSGCHSGVLQSFLMKRIKQGNE
ncbi:hypothetical protein Tco_0606801 [Tanacetum coccineum]